MLFIFKYGSQEKIKKTSDILFCSARGHFLRYLQSGLAIFQAVRDLEGVEKRKNKGKGESRCYVLWTPGIIVGCLMDQSINRSWAGNQSQTKMIVPGGLLRRTWNDMIDSRANQRRDIARRGQLSRSKKLWKLRGCRKRAGQESEPLSLSLGDETSFHGHP